MSRFECNKLKEMKKKIGIESNTATRVNKNNERKTKTFNEIDMKENKIKTKQKIK
jgi:hypothetical protein